MADPVIGATVQVVLEKLISLTVEEVKSIKNCKKNLRMLMDHVSLIQTFIHDNERRQAKHHSVEEWLNKLEKVAEDAETVHDEFRYESVKAQVRNSPMRKVSGFFSHTAFKRKMSRKIKNIHEELKDINQSATNLGLQSLIVTSQQILQTLETDSSVVVSDVVGRDNDVAQIKEKMLNMREEVVLCTIPIVGMGGLGKTTIAKRIFNDEEIDKHFKKRVWLCLPEISDTKSFLQQILESLTERKPEVQTRDIIVRKLRDALGEGRYLLVLDDLWHVDDRQWVHSMDSLRGVNTSRGNCILVTTRMEQVASTVAAGRHMLEKLTKDHCWSIFKKRALFDGEVPEEILRLENRIVEMCQGLPLAASVLGSLIGKREKHEWQEILDVHLFVAGEAHNMESIIKKILKLSYDYLPYSHLKKCFAYFAMFPKDFKFQKDHLIQLWMAEGFLHPYQEITEMEETIMMEDVGNNFFQLLVQFSLLQDVELDEHNNIKCCKMHDLVHDLAGDILKPKLFDQKSVERGNHSQKSVGRGNHSQVRYLGWDSPSDQIDKIKESGRLCTLFWRRDMSEDMLLSFQFLRVLNLSGSGIEELSASIGKLIYLRYLDLSNTNIKDLPNSICKLYNLQTFRVNDCSSLRKLPEEMADMISLRHIHWDYHYGSEIQLPLNMGQLTSLQTLPFFYVGLEKGRPIEELGCLKYLRGELRVERLQLVRNKEEARTACLQEKPKIYKLAYLWSHDESEVCEINDEHVLDGLQLPPNLKMLEVKNYWGTKFPSWFSEEWLQNLAKLKLSGCKRCKEIPLLGQLKSLQNLELVGFHELECIGLALYGVEISNTGSSRNIQVFPSLKELVLEDMSRLIEWEGDEVGVRMFPRLEKLWITKCPLLKSTPNQFEILRELRIDGVDSEMPLLNLSSNLTSLVNLVVGNVKELTCLPDEMLRKNVSLQHLWVSFCRDFHELPPSLYNLHSLKSLEITSCPNFSSFPVPSEENYLTSLQSLVLRKCDGLSSLPSGMLEQCRSLETLLVYRCNNLLSLSLDVWEMPSLSYLSILECPKLIGVPSGGIHGLTELFLLQLGPFSELMDFEAFQLIFNGVQQLLSLRNLNVRGRGHWDSLPYQLMQLSALTDIHIFDFGIEALPDRLDKLTSLETLNLVSCKRLQRLSFSDDMPKLRRLWLKDCPLLEALPDGLGNLVSLEDLRLRNCEKLEHLPSRDAMRRLNKLCKLEIEGCPELEDICSNYQWSNISHIKKILVDGRIIQNLLEDNQSAKEDLCKNSRGLWWRGRGRLCEIKERHNNGRSSNWCCSSSYSWEADFSHY